MGEGRTCNHTQLLKSDQITIEGKGVEVKILISGGKIMFIHVINMQTNKHNLCNFLSFFFPFLLFLPCFVTFLKYLLFQRRRNNWNIVHAKEGVEQLFSEMSGRSLTHRRKPTVDFVYY